MEEKPQEKKGKLRKTFDSIVMGVIVGGAIGSVVGMAFAPRKGKETRKLIKDKLTPSEEAKIHPKNGEE